VGSHTFQATIGGKGLTAAKAYEGLVAEAEREYGTDPYNGTISTTTGFVMVDIGRRRVNNIITDILEDDRHEIRKWGPAGCIALKGAWLTRWRKRNGLAGTRAKAYVFFGHAVS